MVIESLVLGVTLMTHHFEHRPHDPSEVPGRPALEYVDYQSDTPGVYAVVNDRLVIGAVRNSFGNGSFYLGAKLSGPFKTDIVLGGITGYSEPVIPLVTLGKSFGPFRAQILPPIGHSPAALTFSVEHQFK